MSRLVPFAPRALCLGGGKTPKHSGPDFLVGESTVVAPTWPDNFLHATFMAPGAATTAGHACAAGRAGAATRRATHPPLPVVRDSAGPDCPS